MTVYVISKDGKPLMPTTPARARKLLKAGKAKCIKRTPFTIKLLYDTTTYTQPLTLGVDTGSVTVGTAVSDDENNIVYLSEVTLRNDITRKMTRRASYRRDRRNRKTRYRPARWLNRRNSIKTNRFSPTMRSKFDSHEKEIKFVKSLLPITRTIMETATFDPHALKDPSVLTNKWKYQKGTNYGFANTKAYVLHRDGYTCQHCKSKDKRLEVHHIIFRSESGSDDEKNLITLCKTCHDEVHKNNIKLKGGKRKGNLSHATQMNSIRTQLLKRVECEEAFGYITKEHRQLMGLNKEHYNDAIAIACQDSVLEQGLISHQIKCRLLRKKCVPKGDYQQTKGVRSQMRIPTGKIQGFRKFDKVLYEGRECFIKGRMTKGGYALLMDINETIIPTKPVPKLEKMIRLEARKSWFLIKV